MIPELEKSKSSTRPEDTLKAHIEQSYKETSDGLFGTYMGIVEENDDPTKKCRVKVRIPHIHGNISTEHLPWAYLATTGFSSDTETEVRIPRIKARVLVIFMNGDIYSPVITHRMPEQDKIPSDVNDDYPNVDVLFVSQGGTRITMNNKSGLIALEHESGTLVSVDGTGNVMVNSADSVSIESNRKVSVNSLTEIVVTAPIIQVGTETQIVTPSATGGGLNCLSKCLFNGAFHSGNQMVGE